MNINDMNKEELTAYAESLGVKVNRTDTKEIIIDKINAATGQTQVPDAEQQADKTDKSGKSKNNQEEEITVVFNPGADGDNSSVFFGINGKQMSLPRNKPVKVKRKYLNMLSKEAVGFRVITKEVDGKVVEERIPTPAYTWSVVEEG